MKNFINNQTCSFLSKVSINFSRINTADLDLRVPNLFDCRAKTGNYLAEKIIISVFSYDITTTNKIQHLYSWAQFGFTPENLFQIYPIFPCNLPQSFGNMFLILLFKARLYDFNFFCYGNRHKITIFNISFFVQGLYCPTRFFQQYLTENCNFST